ncbi:MAG: response regulator [Verrucomicrobiales bacterium]
MATPLDHDWLEDLREELHPAGDKLCSLIADLAAPEASEAGTQLSLDLEKLRAEGETFREELDKWFPADIDRRDPAAFETAMRSARHDARNRLNHLFGVVQLIQLAPCPPETLEKTRELMAHLEVCLAAVSRTAPEIESEAPPPLSPADSELAGAAGYLLVADDDPENREILRRLLTPCGFRLDFAENGLEAIRQIEAKAFDAVLLDIEMPEMDGFEVLARLRESGHLRHTPVIVVTGLQEEQDAVRCIEIGAEDFLSRPIRPALLMARLNASLEKKRLREKVFEQHFTPELARELARNPDPMNMQPRQAEVTVLFCDIRGFSAISERLGPSQTIDWLGGVMGDFSSIVINHGGVLVDYTGDELMAMWGAPSAQPDHATLGCRAALEIMGRLPEINAKWRPLVDAETEVGIGVNTGEALVGNIGTHRKFKYGPLGTTVNLASRVQGATRFLKTSLLITGNTARQLPPSLRTRRLCQVRVQNISAAVDLHEMELPSAPKDWGVLTKRYEQALEEFERGNFRQASSVIGDMLVAVPDDGPSLQLMARIVDAMLKEGEDFSPIWTLPGK